MQRHLSHNSRQSGRRPQRSTNSRTSSDNEDNRSQALFHRDGGRKPGLSIFSVDDAYGWLIRIDRYFKVNGVEDDEKLNSIFASLGESYSGLVPVVGRQHSSTHMEEVQGTFDSTFPTRDRTKSPSASPTVEADWISDGVL